GYRLDCVQWKTSLQLSLQIQFENFSLKLLRSLLSLALQVLYLSLHGSYCFFALLHLKFECLLCLTHSLSADECEPLSHLLFNGEVKLALRILELPLFSQHIQFSPLSFREFFVSLVQNVLQLGDFVGLLTDFDRESLPSLAGLFSYDSRAFLLHLLRNGRFDRRHCFGNGLFALAQPRFPFRAFSFLFVQPLLVLATRG